MKTSSKFFATAIALVAMFFLSSTSQAQLNVNASGNVGIGTSANTLDKLTMYNSDMTWSAYLYQNNSTSTGYLYGIYNSVNGTSTSGRYGIYNNANMNSATTSAVGYGMYNYLSSYGSGTTYGLYNYARANTGSGTRYGLYNYLYCGSNTGTKYALYSAVSCGGNYAGYFSGNVYISGTLTQTSDAAKKENIQDLNSGLNIVNQLSAKTYNYKQEAGLALPEGRQVGFLAQDVEQVMPEAVSEVDVPGAPNMEESGDPRNPNHHGPNPEDTQKIKTVNYISMIPVLVKAIQEQQDIIQNQQKEIEALKAKVGN